MTVYIYGRVSSQSSANSGLSETSQYELCKQYVENVLDKEILGELSFPTGNPRGYFFDRAVSAWKSPFDSRPAAHALSSVLKPGDHVVFYNIERGFRSTKAFCLQIDYWQSKHITPHFVSENINFASAEGRMISKMMAVFAEYYSDLISERTREAKAIQKLLRKEIPKEKKIKTDWGSSSFKFRQPIPKASIAQTTGTIYLYSRCSSVDSTISGLGMDAQLSGNQKYADRLMQARPGMTLSSEEFRDESVSAFSVPFDKRPSGKKLMEKVKSGDVIVAYRTDRIFRTPQDSARISSELAKKGVAIHIVQAGIDTLSQHGQMMINILSLFAYIESSIKSKRNKEVIASLRESGRPSGKYPRHAKVITDKKTNKRVLVYDFAKITDMACVYICRRVLGLTNPETSDIMYALHCRNTGVKFVPYGLRKRLGKDDIFTMDEHFTKIYNNIPPAAMLECIESAAELIRESKLGWKHREFANKIPAAPQVIRSQTMDHLACV